MIWVVSSHTHTNTHKRDIFTTNPPLNYQVAIHLTSEPQLFLICQPTPSSTPPTPMVRSSDLFLFNPLLLACAFPPFVSMAMLSALHQEPRPACFAHKPFPPSSVCLSPRALSSPWVLNRPPLLFLSPRLLNRISQHSSFFFIAALYLQLFVRLPSFFTSFAL